MKKLLSLILLLTLLATCTSLFTACKNDETTKTETKLGFVYELKTVADGEDYLIVKGFNVSEEVAELVSQKNFSNEKVVAVSKLEIKAQDEYKRKGDTEAKTYPVKEIAESAFANKLFIKEVVIPSSVETIGAACLGGCANIEKLTVSFVGNKKEGNLNAKKTLAYLFGTASATGMTSTTVKYNDSGSATYYLPDGLKYVELTDGEVSDYAFSGLNTVEEIVVPAATTKIGEGAFYGCSSLYKFALNNVTEIGKLAFYGCSSLCDIGLNTTAVTSIGDSAFENCSNLFAGLTSNKFTVNGATAYIGEKAFSGCTAIKELDLSALSGKTATVCEGAFNACTGLTKVVLPANVENVTFGSLVFKGCTELKKENVTNYRNLKVFEFDYDQVDL